MEVIILNVTGLLVFIFPFLFNVAADAKGWLAQLHGSLAEKSVGIDLDIIDSLCYLGDTLDTGDGCEASNRIE